MKKLLLILSLLLIPTLSYAGIHTTGDVEVGGDITATGYISGKESGVFAYLSTPADTTLTTSGTFYAIQGTFINPIVENFSGATAYPPGIKHDGAKTQAFEIDWHATVTANIPSTTVACAVNKNGAYADGSEMSILCKTAGEEYSTSGTVVLDLAQNDEIQLTVSSDGNGDVVTFEHYTTSITEFFD